MNKPHDTKAFGHHALAASHHEQAAKHYHAASVHFESGKDYEHAAHQAVLAHGHSLKALELGRKTNRDSSPVESTHRSSGHGSRDKGHNHLTNGQLDSRGSSAAEHHQMAATQSEQAALHERQASSLELTADFPGVLREAKTAEQHSLRALFHSDEAAKYLSL